MLSKLNLASFGLWIGGIGQGILYRSAVSPQLAWIDPALVFPP